MLQTPDDTNRLILASDIRVDAQILLDQVADFEFVAAANPELFRECALELLIKASDRLADLVARCGD